jgi:hypothetical protein
LFLEVSLLCVGSSVQQDILHFGKEQLNEGCSTVPAR